MVAEREGEAAAKTETIFDIRPLVAIWCEESIGRRLRESEKPLPGRKKRSFETGRSVVELDRAKSASSLQMGAFMGSGLCGEEIIVVHSQTHSIASNGQRLSCGCIEEVGAAVVDFVGEV